jgi:glycopeptide antibiotics resistance protein
MRRSVVFAVVYGAVVMATILAPLDPNLFWNFLHDRLGVGWTPGRELGLDVIVNVLLFAPLGYLAHAWSRRRGPPRVPAAVAIVLAAAVLSAAFETVQWVAGHRQVAILDVVSNAAGAAVGCLAERLVGGARTPGPAPAPTVEDS